MTEADLERRRKGRYWHGHLPSIKEADREREQQQSKAELEAADHIPVEVADGWEDLWRGRVR